MVRFCCFWIVALEFFSTARAGVTEDAAKILETAGITGGFVVHLGAADGELTVALQTSKSLQVQGLVKDAAAVDAARAAIRKAGKYGDVSAIQFAGKELPYIDNLVNLLIVEEPGDLTQDELLRVVVPNGVVLKRDADGNWVKTVKPRPTNIDECRIICTMPAAMQWLMMTL